MEILDQYGVYMQKHTQLPLPAKRVILKVGSDIRDARLRRRLPMKLIGERAVELGVEEIW